MYQSNTTKLKIIVVYFYIISIFYLPLLYFGADLINILLLHFTCIQNENKFIHKHSYRVILC